MEKVKIAATKANANVYDVKMTVTKGKIIALMTALEGYANNSTVAEDLLGMFKEAFPEQKG